MELALISLLIAWLWNRLLASRRWGAPVQQALTPIPGHLLEVLLYGPYPRAMLTALGAVGRACGRLCWALLPPSLWLAVPCWWALAWSHAQWAYAPVPPGEAILVRLTPRLAGDPPPSLRPQPQLTAEVSAFRDPQSHSLYWRLRPQAEGLYLLRWEQGGQSWEVTLRASSKPGARLELGLFPWGVEWLWSPWRPPLGSQSPVQELRLLYPERSLRWGGWPLPWWLPLVLGVVAWSWVLHRLPSRQAPPQWSLSKKAEAGPAGKAAL